MCGIVATISYKNVSDVLINGLKKLEYRGYDSAGIAIINNKHLQIVKSVGKVIELDNKLKDSKVCGEIGIAHTRWATHGIPSVENAHPHVSDDIAIVHNGIIENYLELKEVLLSKGYQFVSQTDTEVFAHLINDKLKDSKSLFEAIVKAKNEVIGAYGVAVIDVKEPNRIITIRKGSPIVIGLGNNENYVASDSMALGELTSKFIYLEDDDIADITTNNVTIYDKDMNVVKRDVHEEDFSSSSEISKGHYQHYMQKEIFEQTEVIKKTLEGRILHGRFVPEAFGIKATEIFKKIENIFIVACGTSYHAGLVAKYWIEEYLSIRTTVEIASEFRYRKTVTPNNCLFITISQSGETADTLAALRKAKEQGYAHSLTICNVQTSSLVRESELVFLTRAGKEIGVASTKAFTTQLVSFINLIGSIGTVKGILSEEVISSMTSALEKLPEAIQEVLEYDSLIQNISKEFVEKTNALYLGRGAMSPVAMEGALKLKEISYIHAEAYAAGELKHGPLALVDDNMPVIVVAPDDNLLDKLVSNIQEVNARGGIIYIFTSKNLSVDINKNGHIKIIETTSWTDTLTAPIVYTIPLQLLSYHVALLKGTDVDQPRNLAKSVTVE